MGAPGIQEIIVIFIIIGALVAPLIIIGIVLFFVFRKKKPSAPPIPTDHEIQNPEKQHSGD